MKELIVIYPSVVLTCTSISNWPAKIRDVVSVMQKFGLAEAKWEILEQFLGSKCTGYQEDAPNEAAESQSESNVEIETTTITGVSLYVILVDVC